MDLEIVFDAEMEPQRARGGNFNIGAI